MTNAVNICRYTAAKDEESVFAIVLFWPRSGFVTLGAPLIGPETRVSFVGYEAKINVGIQQLYNYR